eukprot:14058530-Alexandrium_andersonii.AAC.1
MQIVACPEKGGYHHGAGQPQTNSIRGPYCRDFTRRNTICGRRPKSCGAPRLTMYSPRLAGSTVDSSHTLP